MHILGNFDVGVVLGSSRNESLIIELCFGRYGVQRAPIWPVAAGAPRTEGLTLQGCQVVVVTV